MSTTSEMIFKKADSPSPATEELWIEDKSNFLLHKDLLKMGVMLVANMQQAYVPFVSPRPEVSGHLFTFASREFLSSNTSKSSGVSSSVPLQSSTGPKAQATKKAGDLFAALDKLCVRDEVEPVPVFLNQQNPY